MAKDIYIFNMDKRCILLIEKIIITMLIDNLFFQKILKKEIYFAF